MGRGRAGSGHPARMDAALGTAEPAPRARMAAMEAIRSRRGGAGWLAVPATRPGPRALSLARRAAHAHITRMDRSIMDPALHATLTGWRRHLHAHPELTLHEKETAAFVRSRLKDLGVPFEAGIGGPGVVATLRRGASNRAVGLRADMDALPITETSGLSHASTNPGVMHACGHDGHTVSLLGAAALLARDPSWSGTVHFVFQPAEEG